eukprot:470090-Prymnesium_polylepis.1
MTGARMGSSSAWSSICGRGARGGAAAQVYNRVCRSCGAAEAILEERCCEIGMLRNRDAAK